MKKLLTAQSTNLSDASNAIVTEAKLKETPFTVHCFGNFDTCTVTVFMSLNGTSDGVAIDELTFIEPGFQIMLLPAGVTVWANVSSAGASTSVSLWVGGQGAD